MTTTERNQFSNIRLWMRIYCLSEICTADGKHIARESLTEQHVPFTNQLWPMQTKTGPKRLRCWQRMLSKIYLQQGTNISTRTANLHIKNELGSWKHTSEWLRKKWEYQYSPQNNLMYKRFQQKYTVHTYKHQSRGWRRSQQREKLVTPISTETIENLPADITPVDRTHNDEAISINSITTIMEKEAKQ